MTNPTPEQLEADIVAQREQLAGTVDQLTAKLDVKSQARHKVAAARERATTASGKPRPELIGGVVALVAVVGGLWWWRRR